MSTTRLNFPDQQTPASKRGMPQRTQTLRLGAFADGQRSALVRMTYSPEIGSFGRVERK
jgi:hypothetical protein